MRKLTRKEITEGLEAMPIENILLGANSKSKVTLTAKQKAFAEEVAKGTPKANAYRKTYESKGKPATQANQAYKLASQPDIAAMIEAQKVAIEAQKYQTPAHLRALTIHELTKHALSEDNPPAQRIKALELLGKITEVALFTERREVVKVDSSDVMKAKLMESIKLAMQSTDIIEAEYSQADDLLAEIQSQQADNDADLISIDTQGVPAVTPHDDDGMMDNEAHIYSEDQHTRTHSDTEPAITRGTASTIGTGSTPLPPDPLNSAEPTPIPMHSIPLTQLQGFTNASTMPTRTGIDVPIDTQEVTAVTPQGVWVSDDPLDNHDLFQEEVPPNNSKLEW
jgi:hypothetical protein